MAWKIVLLLSVIQNFVFGYNALLCQNDSYSCRKWEFYNFGAKRSNEITTLNLQNTNLRTLDPQLLRRYPTIKTIDLTNNELECGCDTRWVYLEFIARNVKLIGTCASPPEMKGVNLMSLRTCVPLEFITRPSRHNYVVAGNSITLPCSTNAPNSVKWEKDGQALNITWRVNYDDKRLIIHSATMHDSGTYACKIYSPSEILSVETRLNVEGKPKVIVQPKTIFPIEGEEVTLKCIVEGYPFPTLIWKKDGTYITDPRIQVDGEKLRIRKVTTNDSGYYKCTATNKHGTQDAMSYVSVTSSVAPFILKSQPDSTTYVGSNIVLSCHGIGQPSPHIRWYKDNSTITYNPRVAVLNDGDLVIMNVSKYDMGEYSCEFENIAGNAIRSFTLDVIDIEKDSITKDFFSILKRRAEEDKNNVTLDTVNQILRISSPKTVKELQELLKLSQENFSDVASAREYFEKQLHLIYNNLDNITTTSPYPYESEDLRPNNSQAAQFLFRIAALTGCVPHQQIPSSCQKKCLAYRTADGTCNNLKHVMYGASQIPLNRWLPSEYENGFSTPKGWNESKLYNGFKLPSPRLVSATVLTTRHITPDPIFTEMLMQWGQFFDHDFTHTLMATGTHQFSDARLCMSSCSKERPCYPIRIPNDDIRIQSRGNCMEFIRSSDVCFTGATSFLTDKPVKREQFNQITSFIDASNVYGSTEQELHDLREHTYGRGLLRMHKHDKFPKRLLPFAVDTPVDCQRDRDVRARPINCFLAGDHRASEQLGLTAMHTIWSRQHNRIAEALGALNPQWTSEQVFQETRKIIVAQMQHISFYHWLPYILGENWLPKYTGYDPSVNPATANVIATAAFRFGHTLINPVIYRFNSSMQPISQGNLLLRDVFFSPWRILEEGGIDPLLRGLYGVPGKLKTDDGALNMELSEHLFNLIREISQDLAALNIQRGRDHGLPAYVSWLKFCNLTVPKTFEDLTYIKSPTVRGLLKDLYGDVRNIDVWAGGVLENLLPNAKVGPLFRCLISRQMDLIRKGDRFWYEKSDQFTPAQLYEIKKTTLAKVICENGDMINEIPRNVFVKADFPKDYVRCEDIEDVNLEPWRNCCEHNVQGPNKICQTPSILLYNPLQIH